MIRYINILLILIILMSLLSNIKRIESFNNSKKEENISNKQKTSQKKEDQSNKPKNNAPKSVYDFFYRKCPSPVPPLEELSDGWQIEQVTCISPCQDCPYSKITYMQKFHSAISEDTSGDIISIDRNLTKLKILLSKTLTDKKGKTTKIYKTIEVYVDPSAKARAQYYGISDDEVPIYGISGTTSKYIMPLPAEGMKGYRFSRFPAQVT